MSLGDHAQLDLCVSQGSCADEAILSEFRAAGCSSSGTNYSPDVDSGCKRQHANVCGGQKPVDQSEVTAVDISRKENKFAA